MRVIDYKYIIGTEHGGNLVAIPHLDRDKLATRQFIDMAELDIELTKPTAFFYLAGNTVNQSEADVRKGNDLYAPAIKTVVSSCAHQWISTFKNIEHLVWMETVEGTCAAGINAIYKAHRMVHNVYSDVQEAIIIGHERITPSILRSFEELGMSMLCGDGFAYMRLGQGHDIAPPEWKWAYNPNPYVFEKETLNTLIPDYRVGYVKLHGTGTQANNAAEADLEKLATPLKYKPLIGHTQGLSALLETCMVLDDPNIRGRILVTANGYGGYYGAFTLTKPNARNI